VTASGLDGEDHKVLLTTLSTMRIPLEYLAGLFTAGDTRPVEKSLRRLAAMRSYMRDINLGNEPNEEIAQSVGMTGKEIEAMYRLLCHCQVRRSLCHSNRFPRIAPWHHLT
jgi:respiratory nitrate reductase, beta subunit